MPRRHAAIIAITFAALAGCQSMKDTGSAVFGGSTGPAVGGMFVSLGGSAIEGSVAFQRRESGVTMVVQVNGAAPGVYRVAVHETGNCSSRNGFSAGAPWAPSGRPPLVVTLATNSEGTATLSTRIAGVVVDGPDGILGRAVIVHAGATGLLDAKPGVSNERIACAVIGTPPSLTDPLR